MFIPKTGPLTRLFLISHSHTSDKSSSILSGESDTSLDEKGLDQTFKLVKRLRSEFTIQRLYSSPLKSSVETAEIIAQELNLSPIFDSSIRQFDYGILTNKSISDMKFEKPDIYNLILEWIEADSIDDVKRPYFPGWESFESLQSRIEAFTHKVLKSHEGENVAAITHGDFIKSSLIYYAGGTFNKKNPFIVNDASITIIDFYNGNPIICLFNDICHIKEKPKQGRPLIL